VEEKTISLLGLAIGASLILLMILVGTRKLGPSPVSPNPVVASFDIDSEGEMTNLVVGNSGENMARGIVVVVFDGTEEHTYRIDVEIRPHEIVIVPLKENIPGDVLEKAKLIDVYYNNTIIARRIVEKNLGVE